MNNPNADVYLVNLLMASNSEGENLFFFVLIKKTEVRVVKKGKRERKKNLGWVEDSDNGRQKLG